MPEFPGTKIRAESSSNGSDLRSAGFTPQKIRAELSSNVSSRPAENSSKGSCRVSLAQKMREFRDAGDFSLRDGDSLDSLLPQAFPLFLDSLYFTLLSLHFDHGVEQACSAARGSRLAVPPRDSLCFSLGCPLVTYEASPRPVDSLPPARLWYGSASPTSLPTSSLLQASTRGGYVFQGGRTCFPSAFDIEYSDRIQHVLTSVYMFRGEPIIQGVRMCSPGAVDTEFGHRNSYVLLTEGPMHGDPVNRGVRTSFPTRLSTSSTSLFPRPAQLRCISPSRSATARSRCPRSFGPEASFSEWLGRISHWIWVEITCPAFLGVSLVSNIMTLACAHQHWSANLTGPSEPLRVPSCSCTQFFLV